MARISVLAGTNGAGKSSIGGAMLRIAGGTYYNPDEATRQILATHPGMDHAAANIAAWKQGLQQLQTAIDDGLDYTFETTLGGRTITKMLMQAGQSESVEIWMWYVGLDCPERHLARVRTRVSRGGHDIPESRIRARYRASFANLIQLMPCLSRLRVYDNSVEADPATDKVPEPSLVLAVDKGNVLHPSDIEAMRTTPEWAKPIVARALSLSNPA